MILADKIIDLRKKNGLSQEELAEKLGVSRQSISKWEGAQSVPDMNRILAMADLFGVSTDYLLRDEMEPAAPEAAAPDAGSAEGALRRVTMEEANRLLEDKGKYGGRIALGVMLCVLSPILLIILGTAQEMGRVAMTEYQAVGTSLVVLMALIGTAVALFVTAGMRLSAYEPLEKEPIDTEYGVDGMVRERQAQYRPVHTRMMTLGIVLCVTAVIPLFGILFFAAPQNEDFLSACGVGCMLLCIAVGVLFIVRTSILWEGMQILLEEGEYTRAAKQEEKRNSSVASAYWCAALVVYLAWSFISGRWDRTWIVWPIAGVGYGLLTAVLRIVRKEP